MKQIAKVFFLFAVFACPGTRSVRAETEQDKTSSLEQRVGAIEKRLNEGKFGSMGTILGQQKISVLLQIKAMHDETPGVVDNFKGKRAEIKLYGDILDQKLSYVLMIDPFLTSNIAKDAFITLSYIPHADVQFGQYKFPQNLEGRWSAGDLDFIERSVVAGTFGDKRDFGLQLSNSKVAVQTARLEYAVGFFNGTGQNVPENNSNKDFAGRFGFEWEGLWLGANGILGREPTGERSRAGGEFRYKYGSAKIQSEALSGRTEKSAGGPSTRQQGYYVLANYVWNSLRPGIRWESWDPDMDAVNKRQDALTGGLDFFFTSDRKNKVSVNYTARFEEGTSFANDELALQLQVAF